MRKYHQRVFIVILSTLFMAWPALAQTPEDLALEVEDISAEIEAIRGLKFEKPVKVAKQSREGFGEYLDRMIDKQIPPNIAQNYDRIIRKLGLYRGPEIGDIRELSRTVIQRQAAAYYDPAKETFYVVMNTLPEQMIPPLFAHELYHGLQDQHYDLDAYVLSPASGNLDNDALLARDAVVEGEATYIMTMILFKLMTGSTPPPAMLEMAIRTQSQMNTEQMIKMLRATPLQGEDMEYAVASLDSIPRFLLETLIGSYLKGMAFVFQIQQKGWDEVGKLYSNPPASTEQILYPEKWLADEQPLRFSQPARLPASLDSDWDLLDTNTIGEIQWRIIFAEHDLAALGIKAASGWDGDRYAIYENQAGGLLLLILTSWDNDTEAAEFHHAYGELLKVKYDKRETVAEAALYGREVLIVEGANREELSTILAFMKELPRNR